MRKLELLSYFKGGKAEQQQAAQVENGDTILQFEFPTGYDIAVIADPVWQATLTRIQLTNSDIRNLQDVARLQEIEVHPDKEGEQQPDQPNIPFDAKEVITNYQRSHPQTDFVGDKLFIPHKRLDRSLSPAEDLASKFDKTPHIMREFCYRVDINQLSETVIVVEDGMLSQLVSRVLNPAKEAGFTASAEPQPIYLYSPGLHTAEPMNSQVQVTREA